MAVLITFLIWALLGLALWLLEVTFLSMVFPLMLICLGMLVFLPPKKFVFLSSPSPQKKKSNIIEVPPIITPHPHHFSTFDNFRAVWPVYVFTTCQELSIWGDKSLIMGMNGTINKISGRCQNPGVDPIEPKYIKIPKYPLHMLVEQY